MDFQTDYAVGVARFAVFWLPIFIVAAALHWRLLAGRRWRASGVAAAFAVAAGLTLVIMSMMLVPGVVPVFSPSFYLDMAVRFHESRGLLVVPALFSALVATFLLLALMRLAPCVGGSTGSKPLGGPA